MQNTYPERLLPLHAVVDATGYQRATIYRKITQGAFPPPVKIGRASRWPESEIQKWIAARIAERTAA
ncbi:helix-turn-helix transcriptional regulator [Sinisalibacter lacisalsi]|uniref:Rha family transcriptional regulator n=1 Tax=Sinisalibacter lacisalsi TaxID=1526570 RepID=A0ABQ1QT26_9RHOB|nr:AlpA family transcriptional regulator [Sinisalibacter lacisalsi]GGD44719.1 Rha family transcriptional regulator [Sinisalibacter lacisalsi]